MLIFFNSKKGGLMVRGKYKYKSILKMFFVIILSCIMAATMNNAAMAVVIDEWT